MDRAEKLRSIPIHERFLLDEDTAATMCSVSRKLFRSWVAAGFVSPIELPVEANRKLYRRKDLEAAVDALPHLTGKVVSSSREDDDDDRIPLR